MINDPAQFILLDLIILIILGEEAPHYATFSILPSPHPFSVQILSSDLEGGRWTRRKSLW
jgi:hypothetical protein